MGNDTDFLNDIPVEPQEDDLTQLSLLCKKLKSQRTIIENIENQLVLEKKKEQQLSQNDIPEFLKTKGLISITLDNGTTVSIKDSLKVSLPKKDPVRRANTLKWIIEHGGANIIKRILIIEEPTQKEIQILKDNGIIFADTKDIHSSTLRAWFSSKLGMKKNTIQEIELSDIPENTVNIFIYQETILK